MVTVRVHKVAYDNCRVEYYKVHKNNNIIR